MELRNTSTFRATEQVGGWWTPAQVPINLMFVVPVLGFLFLCFTHGSQHGRPNSVRLRTLGMTTAHHLPSDFSLHKYTAKNLSFANNQILTCIKYPKKIIEKYNSVQLRDSWKCNSITHKSSTYNTRHKNCSIYIYTNK